MPHKRTTPRVCEQCGNPFIARGYDLARGLGRYCSRRCAASFATRPLAERFWEKVDRTTDPEGCWLWCGTLDRKGYGMIGRDYKHAFAHRVSWELANGPIPEGLLVCHKCDTPGCVNPAHLFLGTHADNLRDMVAKGRSCKGDRHWNWRR